MGERIDRSQRRLIPMSLSQVPTPPTPPPQGLVLEPEPSTFRHLVGALRSRYMSMVLTISVSLIVMAFIVRNNRPTYSTSARLLVDPVNYAIQQLDESNPLSNIIAAGAEH